MVCRRSIVLAVLAATGFHAAKAAATTLSLPPDLAHQAISETTPTAFSVAAFDSADFTVEWDGAAPAGVKAWIEPGTLQWVRLAEVLVLPRGRLMVGADNAVAGRVSHAGYSQPFVVSSGRARADLTVALLSGDGTPIEVDLRRGDEQIGGTLVVRFAPRSHAPAQRVFFDPSCSRFGVTANPGAALGAEWLYVGCRVVMTERFGRARSLLEMVVYWDGAGAWLTIGGARTRASAPSVWVLGQRARPGSVDLQSGDRRVSLHYRVSDRFYRGSLGAGIGPYLHLFDLDAQKINSWAPLLTAPRS
jgi:hypothetical protein